MKIQKMIKKPVSLFLSALIILPMISAVGNNVYADNSDENLYDITTDELSPSVYGFATKDQLNDKRYFNFNDLSKRYEVYFGYLDKSDPDDRKQLDRRKWHVVGSQSEDSLVLLCNFKFPKCKFFDYPDDSDDSDDQNEVFVDKECDDDSHYDGSKPDRVYPNHYSSSDLRQKLKEIETNENYFTEAEQKLMMPSRIYTEDAENDTVYYNDDKLYVPYLSNGTETVGENNKDDLGAGFEIVKRGGGNYWYRNPGNNHLDAMCLQGSRNVRNEIDISSAFKLDISSLLFASALQSEDNVITLCFDGETKIKSNVTLMDGEIDIDKSDEDKGDIYLVVQGATRDGDWVYQKNIKELSSNKLFKSDIQEDNGGKPLDLNKCKIWLKLEDQDSHLTYAKLANQDIDVNNVNIIGRSDVDTNENINLGDIVQSIGGGFVVFNDKSSQKEESKTLVEAVKTGKREVEIDSQKKIEINVDKIENSAALSQKTKELFKGKDAICLDFVSKERYGQCLSIKCDLGNDVANKECVVYFVKDNKIELLTDNLTIGKEGTIKIKSNQGGTYILVQKT